MPTRYAWPASALTADDMHALYVARRFSPVRTTISALIVEAVRKQYRHHEYVACDAPHQRKTEEAA